VLLAKEKETMRDLENNINLTSSDDLFFSQEMIGIMDTESAMRLAYEQGMDLVEINPLSTPPVCLIVDYQKWLFKEKKKKKPNKTKPVKEIKLRPVTDVADYEVKIKSIIGFLNTGHKVKITVKFKGRESCFLEQGLSVLQRIQKDTDIFYSKIEQSPLNEGRQIIMILAP